MKLVKTVKLSLVFAVILSVFSTFVLNNEPVKAATTKSATVAVDKLNVRSGAGTKYKKVGSLKKGTKVTVYAQKSSWSQIRYKEKKAYVATKYLKFGVTVKKYHYKGKGNLPYPQVKGLKSKTAEKKINQALLGYAKDAYKNYLKMLADEKQVKQDDPEWCSEYSYACDYDYSTFYSVKYNDGKHLSIILYDSLYLGGAHGSETATSYNFIISSGKQVKLMDKLTSKAKISRVQQYAYNYMMKHPEIFTVTKLSDVVIDKYTQFYYTDGGIKLVFQEYEVGPYAAGFPTVKIPSSVYK
ncbi:DUF4163 domain-containing protein [Bacillus salipaludis]|uniref:DUF3298 domain-containing protein n=1 Tax=Bacillus salipaludis TaxID=2547811 RepID=A0A4R5VXK5_9BACI|nr:SH3 domain-containing protein [Bacillus salipaludis]MDQ6595050.1 DUF3298 domain-containing protein [Bacillus salipaludis]TDK64095.1 DUF4163 domain-containing protein [Bacillus salipaludis]